MVHAGEVRTLKWRTASRCTSSANNNNNNNNGQQAYLTGQQQSQQTNGTVNQLELSCGDEDGLLYIAWSHYGFRVGGGGLRAGTDCSFNANSVTDCTVSVDYVANECNGLDRCHISLDAQYLHSCKAYSHYLFIVYQCVPNARIFDVCQQHRPANAGQLLSDIFYLK